MTKGRSTLVLALSLFIAASPQVARADDSAPAPKEASAHTLRLGPVVGVGVPNLLNFGLTAKVTPYFGFGVNVGVIPTVKLPLYGQATLSYTEYDAYLRVYPFGGGFFLGSGLGYASIKATFKQTQSIPDIAGVIAAQDVTVSSEATVKSMILTPQIGYLHIFDSGVALGIGVGLQVPISPSDVTFGVTLPPGVPAQYTASTTNEIQSTLKDVGQQVIPTFDLKIGYLF